MFGVIAGDGSGGNGVVGLSHNGGAGDGMISKGRKRDGSEGQGQNDFFIVLSLLSRPDIISAGRCLNLLTKNILLLFSGQNNSIDKVYFYTSPQH